MENKYMLNIAQQKKIELENELEQFENDNNKSIQYLKTLKEIHLYNKGIYELNLENNVSDMIILSIAAISAFFAKPTLEKMLKSVNLTLGVTITILFIITVMYAFGQFYSIQTNGRKKYTEKILKENMMINIIENKIEELENLNTKHKKIIKRKKNMY